MKNKFFAMRLFAAVALLITFFIGMGNEAYAATSISTFVDGFPGMGIKQSSGATSLVKFQATTSDSGVTVTAVNVNFSGTGFATTTLADIATTNASGVALYSDDGDGIFSSGSDTFIALASSPAWTEMTSNIVLTPATPVALTAGIGKTFFVAVKTRSTAVAGAQIIATLPITTGVITSAQTGGAGPSVSFSAPSRVVDATAPTISTVSGYAGTGSRNLTVRFSEPVQKAAGGALDATDFTFVDKGTVTTHTISSVTHTFGQDVATLVLSGDLDSGDFVDGGNGISTVAAASAAIVDMAGNAVGTTAVELTSPIAITSTVIPTATTTNYSASPLITFAASGGDGSYTWTAAAAADTTVLSSIGLSLATNGQLTGTIPDGRAGSYFVNVKVADGATPTASTTRNFTINVAGAGGAVPGITSVAPAGGPQNSSPITVTITGANTSFTASSRIIFLLAGTGTEDINIATSSVASTGATNLSFTAVVGAGAVAGGRDIKIITGNQVVTGPNMFGVFAGGGSGLTLYAPSNNSTGVQMPPGFNFSTSSDATVQSYRVTVKANSDFSGTALWDYVFPSYAVHSGSHCNSTGSCNLNYGTGMFRTMTTPTSLSSNTSYYWTVKTYSQSVGAIDGSGATTNPVETSQIFKFTTTASVTDTVPPTITHRPLFKATQNATLNIYARIMDNFATENTTPALTAKIYYCKVASCTPTTEVAGTAIGAGYFKFVIPSGDVGATGAVVRYYLSASDGTNNALFGSAASPYGLTTAAAGATSIVGSVLTSSNTCTSAVEQATIFAEGAGFDTTSAVAASNCTFTLSNLPAGNYDLIAVKSGFADKMFMGVPTGSTDVNMTISSGGGGGFGGDTTKPHVKFSMPGDKMMGMAGNMTGAKIFVVFDKAMSESSITASGNMKVQIQSPAGLDDVNTGLNSKGSWAYYSSAPYPSGAPSGESYMAVWTLSGANTFGEGKTIAVTVTPSVTDTAGNAIQGNLSDGSYSFTFSTGQQFTGGEGQTFGTGAFVPPRVLGTMPSPGSLSVPTNAKVVVNFSDPMKDDADSYLLKNYIKLYTVSSNIETDVSSAAINTVTLDSTKKSSTIALKSTYNSGLFAASTDYRVKILGGATAASGPTLGPPDSASTAVFTASFKTSTSTDVVAPTVVGTFPADTATGIQTALSGVSISFSKDIDGSTLTSSTVYLSIGSTVVNGTVEYRPTDKTVYIIPQNALSPNTTYTINVTTGVTGLNGTALASAVTKTFTTNGADTSSPTIMSIDADEYSVAVTFSKRMNAAPASDSLNWARSVLNPATYDVIRYSSTAGFATTTGTDVSLTNANFSYDAISSTVTIKGLGIPTGATTRELYLSMDDTGSNAAKDVSGVTLAALSNGGNYARAPIKSSATTKGALGPGAMVTSAFEMQGGFMPTSFSSDTFGYAPKAEVMPFNRMAGRSSIYQLRLPLSKQIPAGGTIELTFPIGFDVSLAQQDINSPMRGDLNGQGSGTIKFKCNSSVASGKTCSGDTADTADESGDSTKGGLADDGVTVNSQTVIITLSAATLAEGHDFLTVDLSGIVNSTVPKSFDTSGYTIDIKAKNGASVLETFTSMPFFIDQAGTRSISGTITATGNDQAGTVKVYIGSPMTGPMETTSAAFDDATSGASDGATAATYTFSSLPDGEYWLFTDQSITLGSGASAKDFVGKTMPERVVVSGGNATYNFTLASASSGTTVTVNVTGGPANEPLDVFAGSQNGFRVKQVTLDGAGATSTTLKLPDGKWFVGVGPQMPKGPMGGAPPTPNFMPPQPVDVTVASPVVTEVSGTANDGTIVFALTTNNKTLKGIVKDGNNKIIANAEVFAYSPSNGMGTHGQTDSTGVFSLGVSDGLYKVGAFIQGMPPSKEVPVEITSHATTYQAVDGAAAITPAAAASSFVIKLAKPDYTISGSVSDGTNTVSDASVYAYRTDAPGNANAKTDSSGNYTLYVSNGTWNIGAFIPRYGQIAEITVVVNGSNATSQNLSPADSGTFYSVSGRIWKELGGTAGSYDDGTDTPLQGVLVGINSSTKSNGAITGADGTYSFNVVAGTYKINAYAPGIGDLPPPAAFTVSSGTGNISNKNIYISAPKTIAIITSTSLTEAFIDFRSTSGTGGHAEIRNGTTGSLSLPAGSYNVNVYVPGVAIGLTDIAGTTGDTAYDNTKGVVTVDGNESLTITIPTLRTVTGTVVDGSSAAVPSAWVELMNPTAGVHTGVQAGSNGTFSIKVADSATDYFINAMKPGYFRVPTTLTINGANPAAQTITITAATLAIEGQVKIGSTGAANAFVRAEKQGGGFSGSQADANGNFSIPVDSGTWRIFGVADGYVEAAYASNPVIVGASTVTGKDITLTTTASLDAPQSRPVTPANGGTLEDTAGGVRVVIPANALGSSSSAGTVQTSETTNIRQTASAKPVGGKAKEIKATDSDGNAITTFNDSITIEMSYTKAELAATASASDSSIDTKAEADDLKMAYWDETTSNWVTLSSSLKYYNSSAVLLDSSTSELTPASDLSNVATVTVSAPTTHFSVFAPIVSTDPSAPSTPSGLAATAASASQINLSWTIVSGATGYDIYRSTTSDGTYSRIGSEPTVSSGSTVTYSDAGLSGATTYYYKITALNANGESAASSAVNATTNNNTPMASGGGGGGGSSDTTPPLNTSVVINSGAASTTSANVTLTLGIGDATQMMISNDSLFSGRSWETSSTTKSWSLSSGVGLKTVYAKFKDSYGNTSNPVSDTITLIDSSTTTTPVSPVVSPVVAPVIPSTSPQPLLVGAATKASPSARAISVSPVFSGLLPFGQRREDVKRLQIVLNSDPDTRVADSGVGSPGNETTMFGPATKRAIMKFQEKHGIAKMGDTGYGVFGPKTRAKIAELFGTATVEPTVSLSQINDKMKVVGSMNRTEKLQLIADILTQIKLLQEELAKLKNQ